MSKRINRDDVDKFHDYGLYIPTRTIWLGSLSYEDSAESGVDFAMTERFIKNMLILEAQNADPITIIMNNPGGDYYDAMGIYDTIKNCKCHITMHVRGKAMSMGAIILQAADERILSPNSKLMVHYGSSNLDDHTKNVKKWADEHEKVGEMMEHILIDRIQEKHPLFSINKVKEMLDFDTILDAQESISLGLADKVLGEEEEENE